MLPHTYSPIRHHYHDQHQQLVSPALNANQLPIPLPPTLHGKPLAPLAISKPELYMLHQRLEIASNLAPLDLLNRHLLRLRILLHLETCLALDSWAGNFAATAAVADAATVAHCKYFGARWGL